MSITAEKIEQIARALCVADGLDPDEEIHGNQAAGFENYGPRWQAQEKAEGQIYGPNYVRLAQGVLPLLQQGEPVGWRLVPKKPTEKMRQRGGEYNCPTISLTSASNYAVDVYTAMLEVAPIFPVLVSEPNDTANHDRADHVGRTGGSIPPTGAMLSTSPLPPAPGAETGASSSRQAVLEEAAKLIEPERSAPCDCVEQYETELGPRWRPTCDCRNEGDLLRIYSWCEGKNDAARIRALATTPPAEGETK